MSDGWGPYHNRILDWFWDTVTNVNSEDDYNRFLALYSTPGIHQWMDYRFGLDQNKQYLSRHGIGWNEIVNLRNLPGTNAMASSISYGFGWVSKNLDKLYR